VEDDRRVNEVEQARRRSTVAVALIALSALVVTAYRAARRLKFGQCGEDHESVATMSASDAPQLPEIGGPTSAGWREEAFARAAGLSFLEDWSRQHPSGSNIDGRGASIHLHLRAAREAAGGGRSRWIRRTWRALAGTPFERALANLDMAEVDLLRLAPGSVLEGAQPSIQAHVNRFLAKDDPRRVALDALIRDQEPKAQRPLGDEQRELLLNALFAANTQRRRNLARVRSFRNMLRGGIAAACLLAVALGVIGLAWREAIPLCFTPEADGEIALACPQGMNPLGPAPIDLNEIDMDSKIAATVKPGDILLVEFLGLLGAAVSVAAVFRSLKKGVSTPYNVPYSLAILKLPTGAVTAVAGLILMRADFVPGLSALDTPAQILGWALVFGIAQQLVTRVADNRAHALLEDVGGRGAAGDRPLASRAPA
jgi:hypothetical protein